MASGTTVSDSEQEREPGFAAQVKGAVLWRSGSQIVGQLIAWSATFLVIRLLDPADYGVVAMTTAVLAFLDLFNGWGFASALVRAERIDRHRIAQAFGMLIMLNLALTVILFLLAPYAAAFFGQPMVANLLRVQALFFLSTPFIALGNALLVREMNFKRQSQINLIAAVLSAFTALGCALGGLGVWTLVAAPGVLWFARAVGFAIATKLWIRPRFRFAGAGAMARYGGAMTLVQCCWFVQSQSDVVIGGRALDAHMLGVYTTGLFLTQILAAKFVPPLNEVAFAAYSRMQEKRRAAMGGAFANTARLIMLVALPFYFGLAVTAEPLVLTVLGDKWEETIPVIPVLALAMPLMTLQILFAPATNALGRPSLAVYTGAFGAVMMVIAFLIGVQWGIIGLAWAWLAGMAALLCVTVTVSLHVIGTRLGELAAAVRPGLAAATAMAIAVAVLDSVLPPLSSPIRLAALVSFGAAAYGTLLFTFARPMIDEIIAILRPSQTVTQTL